MRKLKKTEDEQVIGGAEYASRLKDHYVSKMQTQGTGSLFAWAKRPTDDQQSIMDEDNKVQKSSKLLGDSDGESVDDGSDDPIGALLKSNTAIFSRSEDIL